MMTDFLSSFTVGSDTLNPSNPRQRKYPLPLPGGPYWSRIEFEWQGSPLAVGSVAWLIVDLASTTTGKSELTVKMPLETQEHVDQVQRLANGLGVTFTSNGQTVVGEEVGELLWWFESDGDGLRVSKTAWAK